MWHLSAFELYLGEILALAAPVPRPGPDPGYDAFSYPVSGFLYSMLSSTIPSSMVYARPFHRVPVTRDSGWHVLTFRTLCR